MIDTIIAPIMTWLTDFARMVSPEVYTLIGSFVEEVVAPIPSPFVLTSAGSLAKAIEMPWMNLLILAVIGSIGKTLGGVVMYILGDKAENLIIGKLGRFVGVSHSDVESIGGQFTGGVRDYVLLFIARAVPIMPSSPISVVCGAIKMKWKLFLFASFTGTIVRNMVFLLLGYNGLSSVENLGHLDKAESIMTIIFVGILGLGIVWMYSRRGKGNFLASVKNKLAKKN